jgi:hypothetical protein
MKAVPDTYDDVYTSADDEARREKLMNMAIAFGAKVGVTTLGVGAIATYVVNQRFAGFRNYASINGKISIPLIVAMFTTSVVTELSIHDAREYPEKWDGGKPFSTTKKILPKITDAAQLSYPKQLLLKIHQYPLVFAGTMALPLAGKILATRFAKSHLTLSQALMQTRVFAQFGVISILMSTVSIRAFVEANDHFGCRRKEMSDEERYSRGWGSSVEHAESK